MQLTNIYRSFTGIPFVLFHHLTSVYASATNDQILTTRYSKNVTVYNISTGKFLYSFSDMHKVMVLKFNDAKNTLNT